MARPFYAVITILSDFWTRFSISFCPAKLKKKSLRGLVNFSSEEENNSGDEEYDPPQLIIKHRRQLKNTEVVKGIIMQTAGYFGNISSYSSLAEGNVQGLDFEYLRCGRIDIINLQISAVHR